MVPLLVTPAGPSTMPLGIILGSITLQDRLMSGVMLEEAESTEAVLSLYKRCAQMTRRNRVHFSVLAL